MHSPQLLKSPESYDITSRAFDCLYKWLYVNVFSEIKIYISRDAIKVLLTIQVAYLYCTTWMFIFTSNIEVGILWNVHVTWPSKTASKLTMWVFMYIWPLRICGNIAVFFYLIDVINNRKLMAMLIMKC